MKGVSKVILVDDTMRVELINSYGKEFFEKKLPILMGCSEQAKCNLKPRLVSTNISLEKS